MRANAAMAGHHLGRDSSSSSSRSRHRHQHKSIRISSNSRTRWQIRRCDEHCIPRSRTPRRDVLCIQTGPRSTTRPVPFRRQRVFLEVAREMKLRIPDHHHAIDRRSTCRMCNVSSRSGVAVPDFLRGRSTLDDYLSGFRRRREAAVRDRYRATSKSASIRLSSSPHGFPVLLVVADLVAGKQRHPRRPDEKRPGHHC